MNINLIGVPINYGCDREGAQYGPSKLRENNIVELIKKFGHTVYDLGDIHIPKISPKEKYNGHEKMKYLNPIAEICNNLSQQVYCSLNADYLPFVMGGDHSLGIGSIAGASKYFKELAVIWIDAHGDINTYETSPSGNIHGMPLAASMNIGHHTLTNIYYDGQKVRPENVYILGGRDIDAGEFDLAEELNLNIYTMNTVRQRGLDNILKEIVEKIKFSNVDGVHLSFDIDVLDKSIVPGTGTAVENGFNLEEGKKVFTKFLGEGFITSMDFVELNPLLDEDNERTVTTCIEILEHIFRLIS
ncbi:arginase [Tissierella sp. P1]|uniref:arginase n=1 Tax=unclassified Tissierella TaxID=2638726 RepID=UPI000BA027D6|nr:arginase [Tissierella sp. P1]MDU5081519.1 arginase [Bacillota bacterium]OZV13667.1 arginase [Tissierella sp. P1]